MPSVVSLNAATAVANGAPVWFNAPPPTGFQWRTDLTAAINVIVSSNNPAANGQFTVGLQGTIDPPGGNGSTNTWFNVPLGANNVISNLGIPVPATNSLPPVNGAPRQSVYIPPLTGARLVLLSVPAFGGATPSFTGIISYRL